MKIALLNLPIDDNYGGNLQRFALVKVLQGMGHDVTHLLVMRKFTLWKLRTLPAIVKRLIKRFIFRKKVHILAERIAQQKNIADFNRIKPFYDKYVRHTEIICNYKSVKLYDFFDAYVVGSDQVWRKKNSTTVSIENVPVELFTINSKKNCLRSFFG